MKSITINDKKYKIPETMGEVTLKEYCRIFKGVTFSKEMEWKTIKYNEATLISRILGESDDWALDLPLSVYDQICNMCSFLYSTKKLKHTQVLNINGKKYTIPKAEEFNLRKWIDLDVIRQSDIDDMFIHIFAVLLSELDENNKPKPYMGNYEELIPLLENYPSDEAMSLITDFFAVGESSQRLSQKFSEAEEAVIQFANNTKRS